MRVELAGLGGPIPDIALPDPNLDPNLSTQLLLPADGEVFRKADYVALGYTHYETWCMGGAGGIGGNAYTSYQWQGESLWESAPSDVWAEYVNWYKFNPGNPGYIVIGGVPHQTVQIWIGGAPPGEYGAIYRTEYWTVSQWLEYYYPAHQVPATRYLPAFLTSPMATGGGGGGGGLHVVSGELEDLPDECLCQVGIAGVNAPDGYLYFNVNETNAPNVPVTPDPSLYYPPARPMPPLLKSWAYQYPEPHSTFAAPQAGGDGEASAFGDVCQASGGKGGRPSLVWSGAYSGIPYNNYPVWNPDGAGGDGGAGDRVIVGGGGLGTPSDKTTAAGEGTWDGSIGQGGGGGRGGKDAARPASNGGRGSFSFTDTTVYGPAGAKTNWPPANLVIAAGVGGGAKLPGKRLMGSRAQGYSPVGMVLIRLMKIV